MPVFIVSVALAIAVQPYDYVIRTYLPFAQQAQIIISTICHQFNYAWVDFEELSMCYL